MLLSSPIEVLHQIVLAAAVQFPLGPPATLLALLLTCRQLSLSLSHDVSPVLYTRLFAVIFDPHAPARRFTFLPNNTISELRRRCVALKLFRNKIYTPNALLAEALFVALFMLTEDDGRNAEQLRWAGLHQFVNYFLRNKIFDGAHENNGWPLENEINSLVMNISWHLTSRKSLASESEHDRHLAMSALRPFVYAAFRYPCTVGSDNHFNLLDAYPLPPRSSTIHGPYPPPFMKPKPFVYFGQPITVRLSPIALIAILSYFARLDPIQLCLPSQLPTTRAAALSAGRGGPTQEDIAHFNTQPRIHFLGPACARLFDRRKKSNASDYYWSWMVSPFDPTSGLSIPYSQLYIPGALSGHWQGACSTPDVLVYQSWLSHIDAPLEFDDFGIRPLYFTLQEHFCYSPSSAVPLDDDDNGIVNAWLPPGCRMIQHEKGIEIFDDLGTFKSFYETYRPELCGGGDGNGDNNEDPFAKYRGVVDVIVTGQTDDRRGEAWGMYKYTGRVRLSDGLAVLLREPMNPDVTGWNVLMRGFVTSSFNFAGRWRGVARGDVVADLETVFLVCKREEP